MTNDKPLLLVALGGNALIRKGQSGSLEEQFANLRQPLAHIARLSRDWRIVITHGNGPQVGDLLLRQECCDAAPRLPLEILVAQTQGQIGYMIESVLDEALTEAGVGFRPLVTLITYVVVDGDDPALLTPTKPIGPVLDESRVLEAAYPVRKTAKGMRRVAGSPEPVTIVERREIRMLADQGFMVICCGGGGIPVVREGRSFQGVQAVIDKDLAGSLLAREIDADLFVIATDTEGAYLNYGTEAEELLGEISPAQASRYIQEGHFPPGSMLPKVRACRRFTVATGNPSVIASIDAIEEAVAGRTGTRVVG